jgi:hypothetical protein
MELEKLKDFLNRGFTIRALAKEFECCPSTVRYWLKKYDLKTQFTCYQLGDSSKECSSCKETFSIENFSTRKRRGEDFPISYCKTCERKLDLLKRRNYKSIFVEYKGGSCEYCGYSKSLAALEFHHRDPNAKDFSISKKNVLDEKTKAELDKCLLLCSNCHREVHENLTNDKHSL